MLVHSTVHALQELVEAAQTATLDLLAHREIDRTLRTFELFAGTCGVTKAAIAKGGTCKPFDRTLQLPILRARRANDEGDVMGRRGA